MLSPLFIVALWSTAVKELTSSLSFWMFNCVFVTFPCGVLGQVWYLISVSAFFLWEPQILSVLYYFQKTLYVLIEFKCTFTEAQYRTII